MIHLLGLDWTNTPLAIRERFILDKEESYTLMANIKRASLGCVLLQTCNRFELYIDADCSDADNWLHMICSAVGVAKADVQHSFTHKQGDEAERHICRVSCGLCSQILGEDQILAQVKAAPIKAREAGVTTPELETLFRIAVTAGKKSRTKVKLQAAPSSSSSKAIELIEKHLGQLNGKKAVVIGNGEMGKLAASLLVEKGCNVTITLRSYRHGQTVVPRGCHTIDYDKRLEAIDGSDILISATKSPHFTINIDMLNQLRQLPQVVVDIAVPRDIDPACKDLPLAFYDMDNLCTGSEHNAQVVSEIDEIIDKKLDDLAKWRAGRLAHAPAPKPRFPLFINLDKQPCLVVGGGEVAMRRIEVLKSFGASVTAIAPSFADEPQDVKLVHREYEPGDARGMVLAVAATNDRIVNSSIADECRHASIPVSVADCPEECSFFFPAVCMGEKLTAGVVSDGSDHSLTARGAQAIRKLLEELEA